MSEFRPSSKVVDLSTAAAPLLGTAKYKAVIIAWLKSTSKKLTIFFMNPDTWKRPKVWIIGLIFLRLAYVFMNEYGLNPFKKSLVGDHVFLTGAGGGIGRLMALRFGKLGCKLSLSDIDEPAINQTKDYLLERGVPAENICCFGADMSSVESIKEGGRIAREAFGDVTILVNNAGIVSGKQTLQLTESMINRTFAVNTISHIHTIKEFLPGMKSQKRGHIVTIASVGGLAGLPGITDYCGSKFGAVAIDECVRTELKKTGDWAYIKTTCICPYFISTGMFEGVGNIFPLYMLSPDEVADRILSGVRQEENFIVIPWRGNMVFLANLFPAVIKDRISNFMGADAVMDTFQGKGDTRMPGLDLSE